MRKLMLAITAASLTVPVAMPEPVLAQGYYHGRAWRDSHGRWRCRRPNGTTGLLIGGAAGAVVGSAITGSTTGTIVGAAGGALLGRHIERHRGRYSCR